MNKQYNLKLDLQFRCNNQTMKFNQFDNNTSDFFIKINNGGKTFDIEKVMVVLASIKPSGKVVSQFVEVKNDVIYADLKPNMVDEIGVYTAQAMLILEDERVVTDTITYEVNESNIINAFIEDVETQEDYTLLTDILSRLSTIEISEEQRMINEAERILAEENRKIEEAKRVEAELVRQHEEADRAKYDATREGNENIRKLNEDLRKSNENIRLENEVKRAEEENKRKLAEEERNANYNFMVEDEERRRVEANTHKEAEVLRVQAENNRVNEEAKRRTTEQARVSNENTRVSNENTRKANEVDRQDNEAKRVNAEVQRQNRYNSFIIDAEANANEFKNYTKTAKADEEDRKANELERKSQEDRRLSNEITRISSENTRKANEATRDKNETSRQNVFTSKVNEVDKKISEIEKAKSDMTNVVSSKVDEVENRFNALTSKQQQDAEIIDARDGETSLKVRLDRDVEKAKEIYVGVEGSHISVDTSIGYAKNVEILGNTIQDINQTGDLTDIRSVGDKVEGQELYEVGVVCRGKNLIKKFELGGLVLANGNLYEANDRIRTDFIRVDSKAIRASFADNSINLGIYVFEYDKNKSFIKQSSGSWFSLQEETKYIKIVVSQTTNINISVQIEEGTQVTPYEPYQEEKLTILSPVQLEKVGDVADRIICKDGVWGVEKSVGNITLDITKDWRFLSGNNTIWYPAKHDAKIWSQSIKSVACKVDFDSANNIVVAKDGLSSLEEYENIMPIYVKYQLATPRFIPLPHSQQVALRSFAGQTNISFLTEIEGTIKASVPKSLGATVNTHTEQIKDLHNSLDRVKKLEESTVSTIEAESSFTTVEATSNGYFEDVKLEGKTLVNKILNNHKVLRGLEDIGIKYINYQVQVKPSTEYTVVLSISKNTSSSNAFYNWGAYIDGSTQGSYNICKESTSIINVGGALGTYAHKFVTKDSITNSPCMAIGLHSEWGTYEFEADVILLEGDHTQNPPEYFEGLMSVGQDVEEVSVRSANINLLDEKYYNNTPLDKNTTIDKNRLITIDVNDGTGGLLVNRGPYNTTNLKPNSVMRFHTIFPKNNRTLNGVGLYVYDGVSGETIKSNGNVKANGYVEFTVPSHGKVRLCVSGMYQDTSIGSFYLMLTDNTVGVQDNYIPSQSNKKPLLYYNPITETWEKPVLRQWDTIEKHSDGKYYYHKRSGEVVYTVGDESLADCITNLTTSIKKLAQEEVYECTNIDLITYADETNYIVSSGVIAPKSTLKVHNNISNVVKILQEKVNLLESNVIASQEVQDMMILESDIRILDMELALMEYMPIKLNLGENSMLRSVTYFNFLKSHIINETYSKDYLENAINKYLATSRLTQEEYDELYKMLYPPVYDIELPIE